MSIKATVMRDSMGNIVVQMSGDFDYENCLPLRQQLHSLIESHPEAALQIDMSGVDFVGSSGISHFVETIKILNNTKNEVIQLTNVHEDFQRVFNLYGLDEAIAIINNFGIDDEETANLNTQFGNRKRTFEH